MRESEICNLGTEAKKCGLSAECLKNLIKNLIENYNEKHSHQQITAIYYDKNGVMQIVVDNEILGA